MPPWALFSPSTKDTIYPSELDKRFHYAAREEEMHKRTDPWIRPTRDDEK